MAALIEIRGLCFGYGRRGPVRRGGGDWVLRDVDLSIDRASAVGIVGESGSGKSTLVRLLCGLLTTKTGSVTYDGREINHWLRDAPRDFRRQNQIVFQNPASSLDPRMRVGQSLAEPTKALDGRAFTAEEAEMWLSLVGLAPNVLPRFPHQLSGGQLQRVALARALTLSPTVLFADEPTSALDVSVQAQVLNLLVDLRARLGLTLVMVSHDLAVVSRLCERLVVMKDGELVESGATVDVIRSPKSAYTAALVEAARAVSLGARPAHRVR